MSTATAAGSPGAPARAPAPRSPTAMVRVEGLAKAFPVERGWGELLRHPRARRWTTALRGVSADVRDGETFGLLGANGAGKTTLFRILSTLVLPDAGRAWVAGADVLREPARVRRLLSPVAADERSLNWRLDARENLRLYAALQGLPRARAADRVDELLHVVELQGDAARQVGTFSSGMRQRLLVARALLAAPRVLLLDEPTRSLDPLSARRLRAFLRDELVGRRGCTILLATHSADEALELCDRVAVMDQGHVRAVGTAAALARRVAPDGYRVRTRPPGPHALEAMEREGRVRALRRGPEDAEGWVAVRLEIPGGAAAAAGVLAALAEARAPVAAFEPVSPTLAEIIERVVGGHAAPGEEP